MKKLFFVYVEDEVIGEAQAVFDETGKLLSCWSSDDANWRTEYFHPFMKMLGFECISRRPTEQELELMRNWFGYQDGNWK